MKEYSIYWTWNARIYCYIFPIISSILGIVMLTHIIISKQTIWELLFIFLWLILSILIGFHFTSIPNRIIFLETGMIQFKRWLKPINVSAIEIDSIVPCSDNLGFLLINTQKGNIKILNQFNDFHDFLLRLKQANPNVELRGC